MYSQLIILICIRNSSINVRLSYIAYLYRFNEECTEIEEENCKTVYDEVLEKKCEMVNITLPQTDCKEFTETVMETK